MIGELLKLHDIRYIISVDDCYSNPTEVEMKTTLFSEMYKSFDTFSSPVEKIGLKEKFEEIKEMMELSEEKNTLIGHFIDDLSEKQLKEIFETAVINPKSNPLIEKNKLVEFLSLLKDNGNIEDFKLVSSTREALEEDYTENLETSEGVLWLIDQNFERVGESSEAGIELAKTIVGRESGPVNFVYILSSMKTDMDKNDDEVEKEFDSFLQKTCERKDASFIYYLYKQRIIPEKPDKMAKALAQGFKRKVCYELFQSFIVSMRDSIVDTEKKLYSVRQDTLNYLLDEMVKENSESYLEFLSRFVNIFQTDAYENILANNFKNIVEKIQYYKKISDIVKSKSGDIKRETKNVKEFRNIELYNYHINKQHFEVSTGDIFKVNEQYYLLVSQPCDTCLRDDGNRVLKEAVLLLICDDSQAKYFVHKLSCFEEYDSPIVKFREQIVFPFEILDLCVLSDDGKAEVLRDQLENNEGRISSLYTDRFNNRMTQILDFMKQMVEANEILEKFFKNDCGINIDEANSAYQRCKSIKPELLQYKYDEKVDKIGYNVQRICRLNELLAVDIVNEFGINLSRIGHAFDFSERTQRNT